MIFDGMIAFLWRNIFNHLQTKNVCWIFNGFRLGVTSMLVTDVGDEMCWLKLSNVVEGFGHFGHQYHCNRSQRRISVPLFRIASKKSRLDKRFSYAKLIDKKIPKKKNWILVIFKTFRISKMYFGEKIEFSKTFDVFFRLDCL